MNTNTNTNTNQFVLRLMLLVDDDDFARDCANCVFGAGYDTPANLAHCPTEMDDDAELACNNDFNPGYFTLVDSISGMETKPEDVVKYAKGLTVDKATKSQ